MRLFTTLVAAAVLGCTALSAQIPLTLHSSFVDNRAGGNGNIGVTRSPKDGRFYVLDFSNANTVHQFDAAGSFLAETPTANCSPGARSPNGITYDPTDDTLWIVDNSGDVVVHYSVEGKCLGGWSFTKPSTNPVGITHDTRANTLWIASSGMLTEWDK